MTIKNRLDVYMTQTAPLIKYYLNDTHSHYLKVDGTQSVEQVTSDILKVII